ncbi:hypothetical protein HPB51_028183 [Rhipicephalus microplus]|uniref:CCHC-type domain-containing protein n=1 Tax=Rhipicephalus microplus TaxID=6941 RepID=A0A9J6CY22_RHIMP|nr:hypothetical protein HPB51_028183 [Rhipicephalus microplus]
MNKKQLWPDGAKKGKRFRQLDKHHTRRQPVYDLKNGQPAETAAQRTCGRCGTVHQPRQCPAYGSTCYKCGKFGHFACVCHQKQWTIQKKVHVLSDQEDDSEQELFLGNLGVGIVKSASPDWFECVEVNDRLVNFKWYTGSDVNILLEQLVLNRNPQPTVKATNAKVTTYLGEQVNIQNECQLSCSVKNKQILVKILLVKGSLKPILGAAACTELNLVHRVRNVEAVGEACPPRQLEAVLQEFSDVFEGIGRLPGEYSNHLQQDTKPTVAAPRRVPCALEKTVKAELERMEQNSIIKRVTEPMDWVHPIVITVRNRFVRPGSSIPAPFQTFLPATSTSAPLDCAPPIALALSLNAPIRPSASSTLPSPGNEDLSNMPSDLNVSGHGSSAHNSMPNHLVFAMQNTPVWFWQGKKWENAVVTQVGSEPRRYTVTAANGQVYMRNRHHLRVQHSHSDPQSTHEDYYPLQTTNENVPHHTSNPGSLPTVH